MKRTIILSAALAIIGSTSSFAYDGYRGDHRTPPRFEQKQRGDHRGFQQQHRPRWSRGQRLPDNYRRNVVSDYKRYRLAPPPRGYHWVRADNEFVLVGVATGLISSILLAQ